MKRHPKIAVPATERPAPHGKRQAQLEVESWESVTANLSASRLPHDTQASLTEIETPDAVERSTSSGTGAMPTPRQLKMPAFAVHSHPAQLEAAPVEAQTEPTTEIDQVLQKMGAVMGHDFSAVEVKVNSPRVTELGALAFCEGESLYFASGQFSPNTSVGLQLIGHELAHVVQQRAGRVEATTDLHGTAINDDRQLEAEADQMGSQAAQAFSQALSTLPEVQSVEGHPIQGKEVVQLQTVAQLRGEYAGFPEALTQVLSTVAPLGGHHPREFEDRVPPNCYRVLWDIYKAQQGGVYELRSAADWAASAVDRMRALIPTLNENDLLGSALFQQVAAAMGPIMNPVEGSLAGNGMEHVFARAIDAHRPVGPVTRAVERANREQEEFAATLRAVMVAAANILSPELHADVPIEILNAASAYNYLHYSEMPGASTYQPALERLYDARWEVTRPADRATKINWASNRMAPLLRERNIRAMLETVTMLDAAGVAEQVAAIQTGIQQYVRARMDAVLAEPVLSAPIASNGAAIVSRPVRARSSGSGRSAHAEPIVYAPGTEVTPWNLTGETTNITALADLGNDPHRTFFGNNLGTYAGGAYPFVYNAKRYEIIVHDGTNDNFFGLKYGGISSMTSNAIDSLLEQNYFSEAQKMLIRGSVPQINSEGGISSINTYDNQYITVAGRGERYQRVTLLIEAALALTQQYEPERVGDLGQLTRVQELVTSLGQASAVGSPGLAITNATEGAAAPARFTRLDMEQISELIGLLEQPAIHRALTFAKLNDSVVGFFGGSYGSPGHVSRFDQDIDATRSHNLESEVTDRHLHEVIVGIAMHHRLGLTAYNPMESAIAANGACPQRPAFVAAGTPDFAQLSKQAAYLTKIRIAAMAGNVRRGNLALSGRELRAITNQKEADFRTYFADHETADPGGGYFDFAAASSILPFWTAHGTFVGTAVAPAAGNLYFVQGSRYFDCGLPLGAAVPMQAPPEGASSESESATESE